MKVITNELMYDLPKNVLESIGTDSDGLDIIDATTSEITNNRNLWDKAYEKKKSKNIAFAEPNFDNDNIYVFRNTAFPSPHNLESLESPEDICRLNNDYEVNWPFPKDDHGNPVKSIWHLGDDFSQLKSARDSIKSITNVVRIAHFDTGYDPDHKIYDSRLINKSLERNFVESQIPHRAIDNYSQGPLNNPGHGTGTLSILAGNSVSLPQYNFKDSIGLSKGIEIVPVRLAKSVVLFKSSNFVKAVEYIISLYDNPVTRCHIITMSMGGLASKAWADVINKAYDKGIFIVTAAGNNFGGVTPRTLVYPARFGRVVAACGVTYDYTPYFRENASINAMQGNFGPRRAMRTAIAAFTPNVPWAKIGCSDVISLAGAGTSSATPQIAAAAALYYQKYFDDLEAMDAGWKKVEAIRFALFSSAVKKINGYENNVELYFGTGVLQAEKMLEVKPDESKITKEEEDEVSWPLWQLLTGLGVESTLESLEDPSLQLMFQTEIVQLIQRNIQLQELLQDEEKEIQELTDKEQRTFINIILKMPEASESLKKYLAIKLT